ncbi:MAG: tetratricopeptide repeat protein [Chloroflexota bacterium]
MKAITLGLKHAPAWDNVSSLTIGFTPYMERRGYWNAWNMVLQSAIASAKKQGDIERQITLTALLARLYQRQSQPKQTIYYYRKSIKLARQMGNRFEEARACSNLGFLFSDEGHWWRSEVLSQHALAIFEELDSDHGRAHTHNHLGVLYTRLNLWPEAERHLEIACSKWIAMNDDHSLIYGFENLGLLYCEMELPKKAVQYLDRALLQIDRTGETVELGIIWMNLGVAYKQLGNLTKSEEFLLKAEGLFKEFTNSRRLAEISSNLGTIYLLQHDWIKADQYLRDALQMHRVLGDRIGEIQVITILIEYEFALGNRTKANSLLNRIGLLVKNLNNIEQSHYWQKRIKKLRHYYSEQCAKELDEVF